LAHVDATPAALQRKPPTQAPLNAAHGGANFEQWKQSEAHDKWFKEQMALTAAMNNVYSQYGSNS